MACQVKSFRKNVKQKLPAIRGSKLSLQNAQLLVSSGVPSLDYVIGGGLPIGTILLVEEDVYGNYSKVLLKYFLAEGVVCAHNILCASQDLSSEKLITEIPSPVKTEISSSAAKNQTDDMQIAWRYQNLPTVESSSTGSDFGHYFNLKKTMSQGMLSKCKLTHWHPKDKDSLQSQGSFSNIGYQDLLHAIKEKLNCGHFSVNSSSEHNNILRIAIHSLGSPSWLVEDQQKSHADLTYFLYILRAIMRSAYAVCIVTIPSHLFEDDSLIKKCEHLSDISIRLESFKGSDKEMNPKFKDYHGLFHVNKIAAINTLASHIPECLDLAFKLRRKKFLIHKLHLPPELQESTQREQDDLYSSSSSGSCGGVVKRKLLDF